MTEYGGVSYINTDTLQRVQMFISIQAAAMLHHGATQSNACQERNAVTMHGPAASHTGGGVHLAVVCDVKVCLVQGARLKVRVIVHKDGPRGRSNPHVLGEVRLHKDQLRAQAPPYEARHG